MNAELCNRKFTFFRTIDAIYILTFAKQTCYALPIEHGRAVAYTREHLQQVNFSVSEQIMLAELVLIATSYTFFTLVLIAAIMVLSILRRMRLRQNVPRVGALAYKAYPIPAAPVKHSRIPATDTDPSTVIFDRKHSRPGVTRVILQTRRDTSS